MNSRIVLAFTAIMTFLTQHYTGQTVSRRAPMPLTVQLEAEYKQRALHDISWESNRFLFWNVQTPILMFSTNGRGTPSKETGNQLSVVEGVEGRQIGSIAVGLPAAPLLFPAGDKVAFFDLTGQGPMLWSLVTGRVQRLCPGIFGNLEMVIDDDHVLGSKTEGGRQFLSRIEVATCNVTARTVVDPRGENVKVAGNNAHGLSPDGKTFAQIADRPDENAPAGNGLVGQAAILIRDSDTLDIIRRITPPLDQKIAWWRFERLAFSPEESFIAAALVDTRRMSLAGCSDCGCCV
jgi:hypothetical protein